MLILNFSVLKNEDLLALPGTMVLWLIKAEGNCLPRLCGIFCLSFPKSLGTCFRYKTLSIWEGRGEHQSDVEGSKPVTPCGVTVGRETAK